MTNNELSKNIIASIGSGSNINHAWHCITRLRFNLKDSSQVNIAAIKKLPGVLDAKFQGDQFQVVIGNNVAKVYEQVHSELGDQPAQTENNNANEKKKENPISVVFDTISGIFTPILPAIVGSGLLKGILSLCISFNWISATSSEYFVLDMISNAAFYFLPFLVAVSSARKFKVNEFLGLALAGIMMYPAFVALGGTQSTVKFFFMDIPISDYNSTVIPIILGVLLLSFIYKQLDRVIPSVLRIVVTPLLALLITAPLLLLFIAPLGHTIGVYVAQFFIFLFDKAGPLAGLLLGGTMSLIIMTGMHYAFFPTALESLSATGYEIMLLPMNFVNNLAQSGAAFAVAVRTKNKTLRPVAISSGISAFIGITEPAMYGVTLKYKKPFYAALIGAGIGGGIFGFFVVKAFAFSLPGITSLPTYYDPNSNNLLLATIGIAASFIVAFVLTLLFPFEEEIELANAPKNITERTEPNHIVSGASNISITAPISGATVALKDVNDSVFSEEILGKGIAILPSRGQLYAPFDGTVTNTVDTKHAIGITSNNGVELLLHVGLDTTSLNGEHFNCHVQDGQKITKGTLLISCDLKAIEAKGYDTTTPIIVTNSGNFAQLDTKVGISVTANQDSIMNLQKQTVYTLKGEEN